MRAATSQAASVALLALAACAPRALPEGMPATAAASYRCGDGPTLAVVFDNRADRATLSVEGRRLVLRGRRPASGIWYAGGGYELRGKGDEATFSPPRGRAVACFAMPSAD